MELIMRNRMALLIVAGLALTTIANAQAPKAPTTDGKEHATLFFYRKSEFFRGRLDCWLDKTKLVENFQDGTFFRVNVPPGVYEVRTNGRPIWRIYEKKYQLVVEAGQDYYLEGVLDYDFFGTALILEERKAADFFKLVRKLSFDERAVQSLE